jgi:hypothetical protein
MSEAIKLLPAKDTYRLRWDGKRFSLNQKAVLALGSPTHISCYSIPPRGKHRGAKRVRIFVCPGDTVKLEQSKHRFAFTALTDALGFGSEPVIMTGETDAIDSGKAGALSGISFEYLKPIKS